MGRLRFTWDGAVVHFDDCTLLPVEPDTVPDPATQAFVGALKAGVVQTCGDVYHEVIGFAPWDLERHYDPAGPARHGARQPQALRG